MPVTKRFNNIYSEKILLQESAPLSSQDAPKAETTTHKKGIFLNALRKRFLIFFYRS